MTIIDDIKLAARFLLEDGFSIDEAEAVRVGMALVALAERMKIFSGKI